MNFYDPASFLMAAPPPPSSGTPGVEEGLRKLALMTGKSVDQLRQQAPNVEDVWKEGQVMGAPAGGQGRAASGLGLPMSLTPGQIRLPPVDLPDPKGVLASPMAPMFAGQYPTVEKYNGVAPTPNHQLGVNSNLGDVFAFDKQQSQLQNRLNSMMPDQIMRDMAASQAMAGTGFSDMERARMGAVAQANENASKGMLGAMGIQAQAVKDAGQSQLERAKLMQQGATSQAGLNLEAKKLEDQIRIEHIRRAALRDQSVERYMIANPNATFDQVESFIKQLDTARDLSAEDRGIRLPGGASSLGVTGGSAAAVPTDPREALRKKFESAQQQKRTAEGTVPDPKLVEATIGQISGKDYNLPGLLETLGNDERLYKDPASLERITAAMKAKFGGNREHYKDMVKAATLAVNEASGNSLGELTPLGDKGLMLRKHPGALGLSAGYNLERGGQTLAEMPKWYTGPGAGILSPNETVFPTWQAGTKERLRKNASILAELLNKLY